MVAWYWKVAVYAGMFIALAMIFVLVLFLKYYVPRLIKSIRFKKIFGVKPERDLELQKFEAKTIVVPEITSRARILRDYYARETVLLNQMKAGAGEYLETRTSLGETRKDIRFYERRFYKAIEIAKSFGFEIPQQYEDYIK